MGGARGTRRYYPIFLDVCARKCLVVGGGEVALRKVRSLLEHGANLEVVAVTLCPELAELAECREISLRLKNYEKEDLKGTFLAIAATSQKRLNQKIARQARQLGVLVNVVDSPELSDFILPSYLHRGDLVLAVSTGGASPALARRVRMRLEGDFGEEYAALTDLVGEVRAELRRNKIAVGGDNWGKALDLDLLAGLLRSGRRERARAILLHRLGR